MRRCCPQPSRGGLAKSDDLAALAADAYIYGFPLVFEQVPKSPTVRSFRMKGL
jgi:hypothetical protein